MTRLLLIAAASLGLVACDASQNPFAAKAAKPATTASAPAAQAAAEPAPASMEAAPTVEAVAVPAAAQAPAAAPAMPAAQVVRFSPNDYPRQEHRIAALIANAETRDTLGETHKVDEQAHNRRTQCRTRACIERSYAEEEAWLRQWEGSNTVR